MIVKSCSIGWRRFLAVLCSLTISVLFTGCEISSKFSTQNHKFEQMTHELFCREVSGNTISLHYTLQNPQEYGIEIAVPTFGSVSTNSELMGMALENTLSVVGKFDEATLSEKNILTKHVIEDFLKMSLQGIHYTMYQEPLSIVNGVQSQIPILLSEFRIETKEDVETYLKLMQTLPTYFKSVLEFEEKKSEKGLFMSDAIADDVIKQCQAFIDMGNSNYLISTFVDKIKLIRELDDTERDVYIEQNAKCVTETMTNAYKNLKHGVEKLKGTGTNKAGLCYFPEGKKYYSYLVKKQTGTKYSVFDMKKKAKTQILKELTSMEKELGIETSVQLTTENALFMLNDLQEKTSRAFPRPPQTKAHIKYVPSSMEEILSPAFYMIPPIDNVSENVIYVNRSQVQNSLSLYTTLAHEGYPGHLYQTTYFANLKPDKIRCIIDYGGYTEGWATYAEMMSYYMAPIPKKQAILCQKNSSIMLGLYALADMGIHYDGWQQEDAIAFFQKYGIKDSQIVGQIYDLILGDPGNYLKYYMGYLEILNMKKEAMLKLGNQFSQREFHEIILKTGPAPFDIVRERVSQWIISGRE